MDLSIIAGLFGTGVVTKVISQWHAAHQKRLERIEVRQVANNKDLREAYAEFIAGIDEFSRTEDGLIDLYGDMTKLRAALTLVDEQLAALDTQSQALHADMAELEKALQELESDLAPSRRKVRAVRQRHEQHGKSIASYEARISEARRINVRSVSSLESASARAVKLIDRAIVATETTRRNGIDLQLRDGDSDRRAALVALLDAPEPDPSACTTIDLTIAEVRRCQRERVARRNTLMKLLGGLDAPTRPGGKAKKALPKMLLRRELGAGEG